MRTRFKVYIKKSIILTIAIGIIAYILTFFLPERYCSPTLPYLIIFFFAVNMIVHYLLQKAEERQFRRFITNYMLATFLRFFLYLIIIIAYVLTNRNDAIPFIITFFILYVIYSIHEVITILPVSNK